MAWNVEGYFTVNFSVLREADSGAEAETLVGDQVSIFRKAIIDFMVGREKFDSVSVSAPTFTETVDEGEQTTDSLEVTGRNVQIVYNSTFVQVVQVGDTITISPVVEA